MSQQGSDFEKGKLSGSIEKVVFFNESTGQCLLDTKVEGIKSHVIISGHLPYAYAGQGFTAQIGESVSENIDRPLASVELSTHAPPSPRTLKKFLKSEAMASLGTTIAKALVEAFPENLLSVLDLDPARLQEADGIGKKRQEQILEAWYKFKTLSEFKNFLFKESLPLDWAQTLWSFYESESLRSFQRDPYTLARKHSLSFDLVDAYALRNGFRADSEERARCALVDLLQNYYKQGHCAFPEARLLDDLQLTLEVAPAILDNALEMELIEKELIEDHIGGTPCLYLAEVWKLEQEVAKSLLSFRYKETPWGWFNIDKVLGWAQNLLNIHLAPLQKEAIETALSSSLTVITGGPGTGKTTLVKSLSAILQTQFLKFALCSPTGRAAKRLEEATGHPAQTIHRLLKLNSLTGDFTFNRQNPLDVDLVLVDEVSMVDISLMYHLLQALPSRCALILVGDADQIPPVGAGNILQSMIDSHRFNIVRLQDIFRQSEKSLIKINAHRINSGQMPLKSAHAESDFHYLPVQGAQEAKLMTYDLATRVIPQEYGITDMKQVQILVPMNSGSLGTQQLNRELQEIFNKGPSQASTVLGLEQNFVRGDKVMVIKNDYTKNLFNGDIGFIRQISHADQSLDIEFDDRTVRFHFEELDHLTLAYAISIHKSQGSEYRAVIVLLAEPHLAMAQRHLIYTAVTRGKEHVFLVADPKTLQTAILSDENNQRWQKLTELLSAERA